MDVVSACPLSVASILWQPRPGAFALTIITVASYTLAPGTSPLADDQGAPNEVDDYWDNDERRSLHVASDLVPFKPRVDVLLVGNAYTPEGKPVQSLTTRLLVGEIDKSIAVYGDRVWNQRGELRDPASFVRMPLRWERAAGGPGTRNPVGVSADAPPDPMGATPVPNLQPAGTHIAQLRDFVEPINYGPVAPTWPGRVAKLYGRAAEWDHKTFAQRPLPSDIDPAYFNAAPPDQQIQEIRSDERIVLENLHSAHARLVTNLQALVPHALVEREGGASEPLRMRCDTLTIDTDRGRCSLTWRAAVPLRHPAEAGRVTVTTTRAAARAGAPQPGPRPMPPGSFDPRRTAPVPPQLASPSPSLPFRPAASPQPNASSQPSAQAASPAAVLAGLTPNQPTSGLPFRAGGPGAPAPLGGLHRSAMNPASPQVTPPAFQPGSIDDAETVDVDALPSSAVPPSGPWTPPPSAVPPSGSWMPPPPSAAPSGSWMPPPPSAVPPLPPGPPPSATPLPVPVAPPLAAAPPPVEEPPASPSAVGPTSSPAAPPPAPSPEPASPTPEPAAALAIAPDGEPELPLQAYPLERCAVIAASIARRPGERAAILKTHDLTPSRYSALDEHWMETIRRETERGRSKLLRAHDRAYVGQIEAERGPIEIAEYARIVVAARRSQEGAALSDLGVPRAALPALRRVWLRKLADDPALAASARREIEAAQDEEE